MNFESKEWLELMDRYREGRLSPAEKEELEGKMNTDPEFRKWAEQHLEFLDLLSSFSLRDTVKARLDQIHSQLEASRKARIESIGNTRKLWPALAIAASVAAISVVGTLLIVRSFDIKHDAVYKDLRRNVEQIKKSQHQILQDITERKKEQNNPDQYAGTGFLLTPNGYVVTNYHVIKDADSIFVENLKFGRMKTKVVRIDELSDIAILMIEDSAFAAGRLPYAIRESEAEIGENVYTLGFPKEDIVYGEGSISSSTGYRQNERAYQVSVPVNPGNSGGPLLDNRGDLTGIIAGIQTETAGAAFAVKSGVLLDLVRQIQADTVLELTKPLYLANQNKLHNSERVHQVKKWKDYILMVRVFNTK
jgi:S1-C subfamily serine protease